MEQIAVTSGRSNEEQVHDCFTNYPKRLNQKKVTLNSFDRALGSDPSLNQQLSTRPCRACGPRRACPGFGDAPVQFAHELVIFEHVLEGTIDFE